MELIAYDQIRLSFIRDICEVGALTEAAGSPWARTVVAPSRACMTKASTPSFQDVAELWKNLKLLAYFCWRDRGQPNGPPVTSSLQFGGDVDQVVDQMKREAATLSGRMNSNSHIAGAQWKQAWRGVCQFKNIRPCLSRFLSGLCILSRTVSRRARWRSTRRPMTNPARTVVASLRKARRLTSAWSVSW